IARVNRVFKDKPNGLVVDFIGISGFLAEATKKYTAGGGEGKPTLDLEAAVKICLEQLAKVNGLTGGFTVKELNQMTSLALLKWSIKEVDKLLKNDVVTEQFLKEERRLSEVVAMPSSDPRIWDKQEVIAVSQKSRDTIKKIKLPPGPRTDK